MESLDKLFRRVEGIIENLISKMGTHQGKIDDEMEI